MKECVIHLEGVDRTGKDSIRRHLVEKSGGKALVVVRSFISQIAYARIYGRKIDERVFFNELCNLAFPEHPAWLRMTHHFIYISAEADDLKKRIVSSNETDILPEEVEEHQRIFGNIINELKVHKEFDIPIVDNSDKHSALEAAETIISIIRASQI